MADKPVVTKIGLGILAVIIFCSMAWADAPLVFTSGTWIEKPEPGTVEAQKKDDQNIEVRKTPATSPQVIETYNYDFLISQKAAIEKQRDEYVAARNVEIADVDKMIAGATALGIKSKAEVVSEENK